MRLSILLVLIAAGALPATAAAQISGTIVVGGLPVGGVISFGVPRYVPGPARRVVIVERHAPARIVVVERWRPPKHSYRGGSYYDRARPGLRRIEVYERSGRYNRPDADDYNRHDRRSGENRR